MMKYLKKNYKKILPDLIVIILTETILICYFLSEQISNLDEIWNYNTARQIMNGLIPYKQISMITTPLLPTLNAVILKVFGDELFVFRILTATLLTLILFVVYKIMEELLKNKKIAIISLEGILLLFVTRFYLDYNFFSLLLLLLIELIELKTYENKDNVFKHLALGFIAGLAICTKQTIGIFIAAFCTLVPLINSKQIKIKERLKKCLYRILGICIPVAIFIIVLIITNSLADFIDYAILGIKTFKNAVSYSVLFQSSEINIRALAIIIPLTFVAMIIFEAKYILSKKNLSTSISKINILVLYAFPMAITIYPIADTVHFLIAALPIILAILYLFFKAIIDAYKKVELKHKYIFKFTQCFIIILFAIGIVASIYEPFKTYIEADKTNLKHYSNLIIDSNTENTIKNMGSFYVSVEDEKKVILLDALAAIYTVPLDIYNKNYDMLLKGNIGKDGEDGIIEEIKNNEDYIYLVRKEGLSMNWQTPTRVIEYVRNNYTKTGEIGIFDVYE